MLNLLLEIYEKIIINESASVTSVVDSIKNKYQVVINYEGDPEHGVAPGKRIVQAYVYGLTKAGNPVIRAYQPYGDTASSVPDWKFFRLDRIKSWSPTYAKTLVPAPKFNPLGDKTMSVIYTIADFTKKPSTPQTGVKQVGKIDNVQKMLSDREKEIKRRKEMGKAIVSPKYKTQSNEPVVKTNTPTEKIPEPEVKTPILQPKVVDDTFKTKGDEELNKLKDLNTRLSNVRKIELPNEKGVFPKQPEKVVEPKIEQPKPVEKPVDDTFKTKGDEELNKIKDLNKRLDNVRKIDLSKIPKK